MDFLDLSNDENIFAYFDVQNLSIDHSLLSKEIEQYKDLIFSPNGLKQIYFKDSCDLKTILLIKNLLSISDYIDNFKVEKYILVNLSDEDYNTLLNESYEYPTTWKMPYEIEDDKMIIADIPKIRLIDTFVKKQKEDISSIEQVMKVYDTIKLFDYEEDADERYPEVIISKKTNSRGMNRLFSYTLKKLGFKSFVGRVKTEEDISYVTLVAINDKKYRLSGIYLFDPSMDTLSKEKYSKDDLRRINYNFFGLNLDIMNRLKYKDKLQGILSILALDDLDYANEKIEVCKDKKTIKENIKLLKEFNMTFDELFEEIKNTKQIDIDKILSISDVLYTDKKEKYNDFLRENYNSRKEELFEKNTDEELEEFIENVKK